jgi:hypothetical protein
MKLPSGKRMCVGHSVGRIFSNGCVIVQKWAVHPVSAIRVGDFGGDGLGDKTVSEIVVALLTCVLKSSLLVISIVAPSRQVADGA